MLVTSLVLSVVGATLVERGDVIPSNGGEFKNKYEGE
jgi:hypothetical protein